MKQTILVLGLGISGKAAAAFLLKQGFSVIAVDKKAQELWQRPDVQDLLSQGLILSSEDCSLAGVSQVILSPGIPLTHPLAVQAAKNKIEVIGEIEMAFRHIKNRCIGVTGSNGKTTTTLLITHVLNCCGIKARALGNVGVGLSTYLERPDSDEVLVVELSSFQLETLKTRCLDFALILNITENHLDRYPSMQEYAAAKLSIQNCLKDSGILFVSKQVADRFFCSSFSLFDSGLPQEMGQNHQAAFAICKQFGIKESAFHDAVRTFQKPPHRLERIAEMGGVVYYNDSKSSNIESVMHAVRSFSGPLVLIVGGTDKGSSYQPWNECFRGKIKHVVAYGMARDKIENEIGGAFPVTKIGPFADAVHFACALAEKNDTVLLSPGCSSYDQFANFERRGEAFRELILQRKEWIEKKQS